MSWNQTPRVTLGSSLASTWLYRPLPMSKRWLLRPRVRRYVWDPHVTPRQLTQLIGKTVHQKEVSPCDPLLQKSDSAAGIVSVQEPQCICGACAAGSPNHGRRGSDARRSHCSDDAKAHSKGGRVVAVARAANGWARCRQSAEVVFVPAGWKLR
jgi:hypothetical protein